MYRQGPHKLIHHVGMPPQMFDLGADPAEEFDLAANPAHRETLRRLENGLRSFVVPEAADQNAKAAQRARVAELGGAQAVLAKRSGFVYSPPPGKDWKQI